jgi:hypothetical protein
MVRIVPYELLHQLTEYESCYLYEAHVVYIELVAAIVESEGVE